MNFQPEAQSVEVDLSGVDFDGMTDLENGTRIDPPKQWRVQVPAYGYRFFRLADRTRGQCKYQRSRWQANEGDL